jgi:hypothetical protein
MSRGNAKRPHTPPLPNRSPLSPAGSHSIMGSVGDEEGPKGFDALLGNMPFLGGRRIATQHGETYSEWLTDTRGGTGGTDYVGYFFTGGNQLLADRGALGLIATDALADGDSRRTSLAPLLQGGAPLRIYHADTAMPWPGSVAVLIAVLHFGKGRVGTERRPKLNGRRVDHINSRLRAGAERDDPVELAENDGFALVGCFLRGEGFILSPEQAEAHLLAHPEDHDIVRPFLTGSDLNGEPDGAPTRFVISFEDRTLEEAKAHPAALALLEERVRPVREQLKNKGDIDHRKHWWRFANTRAELRQQLRNVDKALATARVSKHVAVSFMDAHAVPSEQVVVFPLSSCTAFGILQSRVHETWVRLLAGSRGEGIRYSATECFANFPFPAPSPAAPHPEIEEAGAALLEARADYQRREQIGLTDLYNRLHDPRCVDESVAELRRLHEQLDRAVVAAYGWQDVLVPPFCALGGASEQALEVFHDAIIDRLSELNARRALRGTDAERPAAPAPGLARAQARTKRKQADKPTGTSDR